MSWFKRPAPQPPSPAATLPAEQHSRAFEAIVARLDRDVERGRQPVVLDLGPAVSRNVEFFAARGCTLHIVDLYRSLDPGARAGEPDAFAAALREALPTADVDADLILAWDLVNYLPLPSLVPFGAELARLAAPAGSLFALLETHKTMSREPGRFRILDRGTLETAAPPVAEQVPTPRYRQPDIERCLADWRVETTFLLRGGMQEYIFARRKAG